MFLYSNLSIIFVVKMKLEVGVKSSLEHLFVSLDSVSKITVKKKKIY